MSLPNRAVSEIPQEAPQGLADVQGEPLFCYGTLRHPLVLEAVTGADFPQATAVLHDYACFCLRDQVFPGVIMQPGAQCAGVLYWGLSSLHLLRLDLYEGDWYERRRLAVTVGAERVAAWGYVLSPKGRQQMKARLWSFSHFVRRHLSSYLDQV